MFDLRKVSIMKKTSLGVAVTFFVLTTACSHEAIRPANNDSDVEASAFPEPADASTAATSSDESASSTPISSDELPAIPSAPEAKGGSSSGLGVGSTSYRSDFSNVGKKLGKKKSKKSRSKLAKKSKRHKSKKKDIAAAGRVDSKLQEISSKDLMDASGTSSALPPTAAAPAGDPMTETSAASAATTANVGEIPQPPAPPALTGEAVMAEQQEESSSTGRWILGLVGFGAIAALVVIPQVRRRQGRRGLVFN